MDARPPPYVTVLEEAYANLYYRPRIAAAGLQVTFSQQNRTPLLIGQKLIVASAKTQLLRASAKSIASAKNAIAYSLRQN